MFMGCIKHPQVWYVYGYDPRFPTLLLLEFLAAYVNLTCGYTIIHVHTYKYIPLYIYVYIIYYTYLLSFTIPDSAKKQPPTWNHRDTLLTPATPNFNVVIGSGEHHQQKWLFFWKAAKHKIQKTTLNWGRGGHVLYGVVLHGMAVFLKNPVCIPWHGSPETRSGRLEDEFPVDLWWRPPGHLGLPCGHQTWRSEIRGCPQYREHM